MKNFLWTYIFCPLITTPDPIDGNIGGRIIRKGKISKWIDNWDFWDWAKFP